MAAEETREVRRLAKAEPVADLMSVERVAAFLTLLDPKPGWG
jgi:hypothetical protein